jgi:NADPH:quinone reductase-like Zn-dependent oxidoreductase
MDISQREGRYPVPPQASSILGVEFSGVVAEIGEATESGSWQVGDEVFGLVYGGLYLRTADRGFVRLPVFITGAYAEYVRVSRHMLVEKPSDWSWELAAAIPEVRLSKFSLMSHGLRIE